MSCQVPHRVTSRTSLSPITIDELLADPSLTRRMAPEAIPELLTQLASRVAALKTLEGALSALMLSQRIVNNDSKHLGSALMSAPDLAKLLEYRNHGSRSRLDWEIFLLLSSVTTSVSGLKR
jgi:hypothetical protein